ncbi:MAG TPA: 3-oxoacyl-ACP reductase FabG [Gammaproteobacteria bacterium]|nr:3-oxoacyl-ACP reductase FabG [Gammaproteobacteria bacterium]
MSRVVWVTGASRGIGYGIAELFAAEGYHVLGTATSEKGLSAIQQIPGKVDALHYDAAEADSVKDFISQASEKGLPDILVNNVGITRDALLLRMKSEAWDEVMNVNLKSTFKLSQIAAKHMCRQRWGRMIHVSSVVAFTGNPGQVNYSASKSALLGFNRSVALEVSRRGVTSNVIAPGFIETDMTQSMSERERTVMLDRIPMNRTGTVSDVAKVVLFMASESAGYITGQTVHVNGGMFFG